MVRHHCQSAEEAARHIKAQMQQNAAEVQRCHEEICDREATLKDLQGVMEFAGPPYEQAAPRDVQAKIDDVNKLVEVFISALFCRLPDAGREKVSSSLTHTPVLFPQLKR